jgi:glycosyltransferase involved in cell wall biosynthesis
MINSPKYSIIIPARNGGKYLPSCVDTIISQEYADYELIISDDHSTDGSKEYLATLLTHPNIRVIEPAESLSMTDHWEWALSHAKGQWLIFVGQDDGLQPYFFKLADKLIPIAEEKKIRTIMSQRAYFFWQGCEAFYGDIAVSYYARNMIKVRNSKYEALKALFGIQNYFELPEMYTTSLFHKSILDEAREKQDGRVLTCHPQDANLGVIACSLDNYYLKSYIPLGWIGTSPKSAGMAVASGDSFNQTKEMNELELEYKSKIESSSLGYHELAGDFSFGDGSLYFWQAFLKTPALRKQRFNSLLVSRAFKTIFFSALKARLLQQNRNSKKAEEFKKLIEKNKCSGHVIALIGIALFFIGMAFKVPMLLYKAIKKITSDVFTHNIIRLFWKNNPGLTLKRASGLVLKLVDNKGLLGRAEF